MAVGVSGYHCVLGDVHPYRVFLYPHETQALPKLFQKLRTRRGRVHHARQDEPHPSNQVLVLLLGTLASTDSNDDDAVSALFSALLVLSGMVSFYFFLQIREHDKKSKAAGMEVCLPEGWRWFDYGDAKGDTYIHVASGRESSKRPASDVDDDAETHDQWNDPEEERQVQHLQGHWHQSWCCIQGLGIQINPPALGQQADARAQADVGEISMIKLCPLQGFVVRVASCRRRQVLRPPLVFASSVPRHYLLQPSSAACAERPTTFAANL